jgi:hypothetical protein
MSVWWISCPREDRQSAWQLQLCQQFDMKSLIDVFYVSTTESEERPGGRGDRGDGHARAVELAHVLYTGKYISTRGHTSMWARSCAHVSF